MVFQKTKILIICLPGVEPGHSAWKAEILPLDHKHLLLFKEIL
jgi:hypothetical protein